MSGPHARRGARRRPRRGDAFRPPTKTTSTTWTAACPLTPEEIKGRNTWIVWTAGNDRFWDGLGDDRLGALDFLKTLSSHPEPEDQPRSPLGVSRPGQRAVLRQADRPRSEAARAVARSALARLPAGSVRERAEVSGRRDRRARQDDRARLVLRVRHRHRRVAPVSQPRLRRARPRRRGTPNATTPIPRYYNSNTLVRPYRVGMSCGFCHVGPNPMKPPADPENPKWENLSSNVGAQYFWVDRIFDWDADPSTFVFQLFHTSRPGSLDTSLDLDRQHQQPADDERGLPAAAAAAAGRSAGARRRSPAAASTTGSSTTT